MPNDGWKTRWFEARPRTRIDWLSTTGLTCVAFLGAPMAFGNPEGSAGAAAVAVALLFVSAFATSVSSELDWHIPVGVYLGIALAVFVDTQFLPSERASTNSYLLPLIAFWWFFGSIPVTVGVLLGRRLNRAREASSE